MLHEYIHPLINYLHSHPQSAGIIVFVIAFGEALAVVGTIIPGSVTMTAVGVLVGSRVIPVASTFIWAMFGAIVGDFVSYLAGLYYKERIHKIWPFYKHPFWLEKGEAFFRKHGGKSIIIGRFFGPARSMVPLIAGTFKMKPLRFIIAAIPSASAWAIAYMVPGIIVGALSVELPPGLALKFILLVLSVIVAIVLSSWLIHFSVKHSAKELDKSIQKLWHYLQSTKKLRWIPRLLTDPRNPENHQQLILCIYAIISTLLLLLLIINTFIAKTFTALNSPVYHLLRSMRENIIDDLILPFTILGSKETMLFAAFLIFIWLLIKKYWRTAVHWGALVILNVGCITVIKYLINEPRPGQLLNGPTDPSFPSGHTCLTLSFIGFLAILIGQELKPGNRRMPYIITAWIIVLVSFSRIFLGAHWFTDILGSIFLAITLILLTTISYRRKHIPSIQPKKLAIATISIFVAMWLIFGFLNFKKIKYNYTPFWPIYTITLQQWQQHDIDILPLYRTNRLGYPIEAFNIEWFGDLKNIENSLAKQGWENYQAGPTLRGILTRIISANNQYRMPILPQQYHNQYPELLMTKTIDNKQQMIILRLWQSGVKIQNGKYPLWIGVVKYRQPPHAPSLIAISHRELKKYFFGATDELTKYLHLQGFTWKTLNYPTDEQPHVMYKLHWDGKLLLIHGDNDHILGK